jgi:hypothetical protein
MNPQYGRGSSYIENLQASLNTQSFLSGHYDCRENPLTNCGSSTASFAFLVVAVGVMIFGMYVTKQRRQSPAQQGEADDAKATHDEEGWETNVRETEEG